MKKALAVVCILLLIITPFKGMVSEGDVFDSLFTFENNRLAFSPNIFMNLEDALMVGNTFYLLTRQHLYIFTLKDGQLIGEYPIPLTLLGSSSALSLNLFYENNKLYLINFLAGHIYHFNLADKTLTLAYSLPWPWQEEDAYNLKVLGLFSGELFLSYSSSHGSLFPNDIATYKPLQLVSYNLITGIETTYPTMGITALFPATTGEVYAGQALWGEFGQTTSLGHFNLKNGFFTPFGDWDMETNPISHPVYCAQNNTFYYLSASALFSYTPLGRAAQPLLYLSSLFTHKAFINQEGTHYLVLDLDRGINVLSTSLNQSQRPLVLRPSTLDPSFLNAFADAHPTIVLKTSGLSGLRVSPADFLAGQVTEDILTCLVPVSSFGPIKEKSYAAPLSNNDIIKKQVSQMYPFIQKALSHNGEIYALPFGLSFQLLAYDSTLWQSLGFSPEDVPTTYEEYLSFLILWQNQLAQKHPDISLFESDDMMNPYLLNNITAYYISLYLEQNKQIVFDTPDFRRLLSLFKQIDFPITPSADGNLSEFPDDKTALFYSYSFSSIHNHKKLIPLPLRLNAEAKIHVDLWGHLLFINPYATNVDTALVFMEYLAENPPAYSLPLLYPAYTQGILADGYQQTKADILTAITAAKEALTTADEKEKAPLQEQLAELTLALERLETTRHYMSDEDIAYYNSLSSDLIFPMYTWEIETAISTLLTSFLNGELSIDEFIKKADEKAAMMYLEGQ